MIEAVFSDGYEHVTQTIFYVCWGNVPKHVWVGLDRFRPKELRLRSTRVLSEHQLCSELAEQQK